MKIFHISDLHIGKHLHFYSLAQEQRAILNQIVEKTKEYRPDVIVLQVTFMINLCHQERHTASLMISLCSCRR